MIVCVSGKPKCKREKGLEVLCLVIVKVSGWPVAMGWQMSPLGNVCILYKRFFRASSETFLTFSRFQYGASIEDVGALGEGGTKEDSGGKGFGCRWTSFSGLSLQERRGHLKAILLSYVSKSEKLRCKQEISTVCICFSRIFRFFIAFAALFLSSNSVSARTQEGVVMQKVNRPEQGERGG